MDTSVFSHATQKDAKLSRFAVYTGLFDAHSTRWTVGVGATPETCSIIVDPAGCARATAGRFVGTRWVVGPVGGAQTTRSKPPTVGH